MFFRRHILITTTLCLGLGLVLGFVLQSRLVTRKIYHSKLDLGKTNLVSDSICDFQTGNNLNLIDTLATKDRNLLVFWSPTCFYSKQVFTHQLNEIIVGIYCVPITDDLEYLRYYLEKNKIKYPQIVKRGKQGVSALSIKTIVALPTFVVLDDHGETLAQYIGVDKFDEMLAFLYGLHE